MNPPPRSEAECLLEAGALYPKRVALRPIDSGDEPLIFAGFKQGAFSIYQGDAPIWHFDLEGRWQRAYLDSAHYLKRLDGSTHQLLRVRQGPNLVLQRRVLDEREIRELDEQARALAAGLIAELEAGRLTREDPPPGRAQSIPVAELQSFLEQIAAWTPAAWDRHRRKYRETYGPLPFLPPECQHAAVLQATLGGPAFGRPLTLEDARTRTAAEFARHVREVAELLGKRLLQTRIAFLAGPDVVRQPADRLLDFLELAAQAGGPPQTQGMSNCGASEAATWEAIHAFVDDFAPPRPTRETWLRARERRLMRVSLGVESGSPRIRSDYGKRWDDSDLAAMVDDLKSSGIGVSLLLLAGAGGAQNADEHRRETARLVQTLKLGKGDMVFVLDERELQQEVPEESAVNQDPTWIAGRDQLLEELRPLREQGVKVAPYTLEKQWS